MPVGATVDDLVESRSGNREGVRRPATGGASGDHRWAPDGSERGDQSDHGARDPVSARAVPPWVSGGLDRGEYGRLA